MPTTEEATKKLFQLAHRTLPNIAPEKALELANEVFETHEWELRPSRAEANFYALVEDRAIYLSFAGLASLWCLAFTGYCVMDLGSRAARTAKYGESQIDISACWAKLNLGAYLEFAQRLIHADESWPADLCEPVPDADPDSIEGRINKLFFGALG